jgi:hypothetical protein
LEQKLVHLGAILGKLGGDRLVEVVRLLEVGEEERGGLIAGVVAWLENLPGCRFGLGIFALADQILGVADGR